MAKLTEKQKRFVQEYLVDLNATAAAKRAGYSEKSASRIAVELLNKTQVSAEIQKQQAKRQKRVEITQEKVLEELAAIAFANGADFATVNQNGIVRITPTSELPEEKRKAIASIKEGQYGTEVKVHDKVKAWSCWPSTWACSTARTVAARPQRITSLRSLTKAPERR